MTCKPLDEILIQRRELHPEEDPLTDFGYVLRTVQLVIYGVLALGPASMFYLLLDKTLGRIYSRQKTRLG